MNYIANKIAVIVYVHAIHYSLQHYHKSATLVTEIKLIILCQC